MTYLLCYEEKVERGSDRITIKAELFDDFTEAVMKYTLVCASSWSVTLSDINNDKIIRQCVKQSEGSVFIL